MKQLQEKLKKLCDEFYGDATIVVKDLQTQEKTDIRGDERFYVASIIKMWFLWLFFMKEQRGELKLDDPVTLDIDPNVVNMGITELMHPGLEWTYSDLLALMVVLSDNHCTNKIIDTLTMDAINAEMDRLGCRDTKVTKKMNAGTYNWSTGNDVADIMERFMTSGELNEKNRKLALYWMENQRYNTKLPVPMKADEDGERVIFRHKTGEIYHAECDAGIMTVPSSGKDIVIVCMTKNLKANIDGIRFQNEVGKIVYEYYTKGEQQ